MASDRNETIEESSNADRPRVSYGRTWWSQEDDTTNLERFFWLGLRGDVCQGSIARVRYVQKQCQRGQPLEHRLAK